MFFKYRNTLSCGAIIKRVHRRNRGSLAVIHNQTAEEGNEIIL